MTVAQTCSRHRQRVLVNDLLLEILDVFLAAQRQRRTDISNCCQPHQRKASSPRSSIRRLYRHNVRNPEQPSTDDEYSLNPILARQTTPSPSPSFKEPKRIEIKSDGFPRIPTEGS